MKVNPRIILAVLGVAILATVVTLLVRRAGKGDLAASGTVEATEAQLGFTVPGRIDAILVREGDAVKRGQVLAVLDTAEASARLAQALAQRDAARALLLEMQHGSRPAEIGQARATRDAAQQRLNDAQQDFERQEELKKTEVVSQQSYDKAKAARDVAQSEFRQAEDAYRLVQQGPRPERVAGQRAQVANAEGSIAAMRVQLANMTIRAPFDGVVTVKSREPGEIVAAGSGVVSVMDRNDRWVRIYVSESRIGAVHTGLPASITSDTFHGRRYPGQVVYVSSEAEFTPKNVQTREERVKLVYAVKVRITDDAKFELKPGMPADVTLGAAQQ
jgi:HlyD family secretion protein